MSKRKKENDGDEEPRSKTVKDVRQTIEDFIKNTNVHEDVELLQAVPKTLFTKYFFYKIACQTCGSTDLQSKAGDRMHFYGDGFWCAICKFETSTPRGILRTTKLPQSMSQFINCKRKVCATCNHGTAFFKGKCFRCEGFCHLCLDVLYDKKCHRHDRKKCVHCGTDFSRNRSDAKELEIAESERTYKDWHVIVYGKRCEECDTGGAIALPLSACICCFQEKDLCCCLLERYVSITKEEEAKPVPEDRFYPVHIVLCAKMFLSNPHKITIASLCRKCRKMYFPSLQEMRKFSEGTMENFKCCGLEQPFVIVQKLKPIVKDFIRHDKKKLTETSLEMEAVDWILNWRAEMLKRGELVHEPYYESISLCYNSDGVYGIDDVQKTRNDLINFWKNRDHNLGGEEEGRGGATFAEDDSEEEYIPTERRKRRFRSKRRKEKEEKESNGSSDGSRKGTVLSDDEGSSSDGSGSSSGSGYSSGGGGADKDDGSSISSGELSSIKKKSGFRTGEKMKRRISSDNDSLPDLKEDDKSKRRKEDGTGKNKKVKQIPKTKPVVDSDDAITVESTQTSGDDVEEEVKTKKLKKNRWNVEQILANTDSFKKTLQTRVVKASSIFADDSILRDARIEDYLKMKRGQQTISSDEATIILNGAGGEVIENVILLLEACKKNQIQHALRLAETIKTLDRNLFTPLQIYFLEGLVVNGSQDYSNGIREMLKTVARRDYRDQFVLFKKETRQHARTKLGNSYRVGEHDFFVGLVSPYFTHIFDLGDDYAKNKKILLGLGIHELVVYAEKTMKKNTSILYGIDNGRLDKYSEKDTLIEILKESMAELRREQDKEETFAEYIFCHTLLDFMEKKKAKPDFGKEISKNVPLAMFEERLMRYSEEGEWGSFFANLIKESTQPIGKKTKKTKKTASAESDATPAKKTKTPKKVTTKNVIEATPDLMDLFKPKRVKLQANSDWKKYDVPESALTETERKEKRSSIQTNIVTQEEEDSEGGLYVRKKSRVTAAAVKAAANQMRPDNIVLVSSNISDVITLQDMLPLNKDTYHSFEIDLKKHKTAFRKQEYSEADIKAKRLKEYCSNCFFGLINKPDKVCVEKCKICKAETDYTYVVLDPIDYAHAMLRPYAIKSYAIIVRKDVEEGRERIKKYIDGKKGIGSDDPSFNVIFSGEGFEKKKWMEFPRERVYAHPSKRYAKMRDIYNSSTGRLHVACYVCYMCGWVALQNTACQWCKRPSYKGYTVVQRNGIVYGSMPRHVVWRKAESPGMTEEWQKKQLEEKKEYLEDPEIIKRLIAPRKIGTGFDDWIEALKKSDEFNRRTVLGDLAEGVENPIPASSKKKKGGSTNAKTAPHHKLSRSFVSSDGSDENENGSENDNDGGGNSDADQNVHHGQDAAGSDSGNDGVAFDNAGDESDAGAERLDVNADSAKFKTGACVYCNKLCTDINGCVHGNLCPSCRKRKLSCKECDRLKRKKVMTVEETIEEKKRELEKIQAETREIKERLKKTHDEKQAKSKQSADVRKDKEAKETPVSSKRGNVYHPVSDTRKSLGNETLTTRTPGKSKEKEKEEEENKRQPSTIAATASGKSLTPRSLDFLETTSTKYDARTGVVRYSVTNPVADEKKMLEILKRNTAETAKDETFRKDMFQVQCLITELMHYRTVQYLAELRKDGPVSFEEYVKPNGYSTFRPASNLARQTVLEKNITGTTTRTYDTILGGSGRKLRSRQNAMQEILTWWVTSKGDVMSLEEVSEQIAPLITDHKSLISAEALLITHHTLFHLVGKPNNVLEIEHPVNDVIYEILKKSMAATKMSLNTNSRIFSQQFSATNLFKILGIKHSLTLDVLNVFNVMVYKDWRYEPPPPEVGNLKLPIKTKLRKNLTGIVPNVYYERVPSLMDPRERNKKKKALAAAAAADAPQASTSDVGTFQIKKEKEDDDDDLMLGLEPGDDDDDDDNEKQQENTNPLLLPDPYEEQMRNEIREEKEKAAEKRPKCTSCKKTHAEEGYYLGCDRCPDVQICESCNTEMVRATLREWKKLKSEKRPQTPCPKCKGEIELKLYDGAAVNLGAARHSVLKALGGNLPNCTKCKVKKTAHVLCPKIHGVYDNVCCHTRLLTRCQSCMNRESPTGVCADCNNIKGRGAAYCKYLQPCVKCGNRVGGGRVESVGEIYTATCGCDNPQARYSLCRSCVLKDGKVKYRPCKKCSNIVEFPQTTQ